MAITATRNTGRRRPRTDRLDLPGTSRVTLLPRVDRENASRIAETIARFLGTGRYLAIQTGIVIVWIGLNVAVPLMRWDPYPFILLNLAFSTQAAYAAPLILLAQNRQDDRDRASLTEDRAVAGRMRDDTEFLTREVAALRLAQSEAATRQYVRGELAGQFETFRGDLERLLAAHLPMTGLPTTGEGPRLAPRADTRADDQGTTEGAPSADPHPTPDAPDAPDAPAAPVTPVAAATAAAARTGHTGALPTARVAARTNTRTSTGRAHHRTAAYAGATHRGTERPKKGD
ncbi:DUF1003 domain-containing protein [Frankia sp. AgPm24]|uniref:DUF1003 domain-containing protein n=1 Tax=Frankia sp. AgPm24 TaxID=631128 RepID=UPI00200D408B|nr:DUF1003 domain-containing protein [Frankia sp. AgPm24]MCK9922931.1 DUF1003 domain-containing protein [Frankia sp. AgPm24]